MTTEAENEILTCTGPGTKMGALIRRYWIPAAMSSELTADGDPVRLMLLGEKLIAFRDSSGKVGVMDHRCPHRRASLFFGRNEEGGIRCVYHGWKFDADGNCLDMANVPPHQDFKAKVKAKAYRTAERNGLVWVYMGDQADVPPLPPIEATLLPEDQVDITFIQRDCNWLQAAEGELDTSHIGFLHYGGIQREQFGATTTARLSVGNRAPEFMSSETGYGYVYAAHRPAEQGRTYWRFGQFLFPFWTMPPIGRIDGNFLTRAYVPVDDETCMIVIVERKGVLDHLLAQAHVKGHPRTVNPDAFLPNGTGWKERWRLAQNAGNDYGIDRDYQRDESYTGLLGFVLQDQMITESMGGIVDRTREHLAPADVMITRTRRCLLRAAQTLAETGAPPPGAADPQVFEAVRGGHFIAAAETDWQDAYREEVTAAPLPAAVS